MSRHLEDKLQEQLVIWLSLNNLLYCASSGGMHTPNKRAAARMVRMGYRAGHPDVMIYEPRGGWHGMLIELKVSDYPDLNQKGWKTALLGRGYYAIIIPGKFDFWEARKWLQDEVERYIRGEIKRI